MWHRIVRGEGGDASRANPTAGPGPRARRSYYRVSAWVPLRLRPLAPSAVEAAIYDLTLPGPLAPAAIGLDDEKSALMGQLRRIEEKLDLLLGTASIDAPRPLSGSDRRWIVFSGSGLALDVEFDFRRGDAYRVDLLLPVPDPRVVRAVAEAVHDPVGSAAGPGMRRLALAFRHIEASERDALVAYSYDIQRLELRARVDGAPARA